MNAQKPPRGYARSTCPMTSIAPAALMVLGLFGSQGSARAGDSPDFLRFTKVENKPPAASAVARENVLALDTAMMGIYEDNLGQFKRNLLNRVPIIVAMFSGGGGRLILYRPGQEPLTAAPVPDVYAIMKSVSHSSMAIYELVGPYVDNSGDPSWRGPMLAFRVRCQTALEGVDALELSTDDDLVDAIMRFADLRKRRTQLAAGGGLPQHLATNA